MRTGCWNWIVILSKKRIPVNYWKILSQYTVKTTKIDRQRFETFWPRKTSDSFDKYDNKQTCTWSSWQASLPFAVFFLKTNERKMEATSSQTQYPVFKRLQRHIGEPILTVLFWPKKVFQHGAFAFWFYIFKGNLVLLFVSQLKVLFSDACQMTVKSFVLYLFPVSLTRKPYNKHLISVVFRSVQ